MLTHVDEMPFWPVAEKEGHDRDEPAAAGIKPDMVVVEKRSSGDLKENSPGTNGAEDEEGIRKEDDQGAPSQQPGSV